jgi:hypothetical protein
MEQEQDMGSSNSVYKDVRSILDEVAKAPGWKVISIGKNHAQVVNPQGDAWTQPSSPGQQSSVQRTKAALKTLGYDIDAIAKQREVERKEKMRLMRAEEEKQLAAAVKAAESRAKAEQERLRGSGVPGTRVPGIEPPEWIGFQRVVKVVTPWEAKVALKFLEDSPCNRRRLKQGNLLDLRGAVSDGAMLFSPEDIVMDEHGCLVDGKHRYEILASTDPEVLREQYPEYVNEHGQPGMLFEIVINAPAVLNSVYNTGASRSPADVLTNRGVTKYETGVAAAIALLLCYDENKVHWTLYNRQRHARNTRQRAFEDTYRNLLDVALDDMLVLTRMPLKMTQAVALAGCFIAHRDLPHLDQHYIHPEGFDTTPWQQFRAGLFLGTNLGTNDPRAPFRDYLIGTERYKETNNRLVQFFHFLKTVEKWDMVQKGDKKGEAKMVKVAANEDIARFR